MHLFSFTYVNENAHRHLQQKIRQNFSGSEKIVENYDIDITGTKIDCMRDGQWCTCTCPAPAQTSFIDKLDILNSKYTTYSLFTI